jgi:sorbitol-specific phosphotransferase system component IIC
MINFSWKKINNKFAWNAYDVLQYFFLKQGLEIPAYLNRKIPKKVVKAVQLPYPEGACFLIHPNQVLLGAKAPQDLFIYLELASMRSKFDYFVRGIRYLPLALVPEYLLGCIETNPLLKLENERVYFKYEQEKQYVN